MLLCYKIAFSMSSVIYDLKELQNCQKIATKGPIFF